MSATFFRTGIFGYPISHTRSPAMHHAAAQALGISLSYTPFSVPPSDLESAVQSLRTLGFHGINLTVPHKEKVIPFLDEVSTGARVIGAVNTIVAKGAKLEGHNTDAEGLMRSLEEEGIVVEGKVATVIGAGGAARAAIWGLATRGAKEIRVVARRQEQSKLLAGELDKEASGTNILPLPWKEPGQAFKDAALVVQATSATLEGDEAARQKAKGFASLFPWESLPKNAAVVDLVYKPRQTAVLQTAAEHGLKVVDGLGMLLHQGALAFELWTGEKAPIDAMHAALL